MLSYRDIAIAITSYRDTTFDCQNLPKYSMHTAPSARYQCTDAQKQPQCTQVTVSLLTIPIETSYAGQQIAFGYRDNWSPRDNSYC